MIRTLLACIIVLGALVSAVATLTRGFTYWTFEDVRRSDARDGRLAATRIDVVDSSGHASALWAAQDDSHAIIVVDFIYTHCVTICQALGSEFAQMQAALASRDLSVAKPRLISLSVDVERDDGDALSAYARRNGADPRIWIVAAPRTLQASSLLMKQLGVIAVPDGFGGYVHNGTIHVIDGSGVVHAIYDSAKWREALDAALTLVAEQP